MPQSFTDLLYYYVWSTKHRENLIPVGFQSTLYAYLGGIAKNHKATLLAAGGIPDHVHLLVRMHPTIAVAEMAALFKANSTKWIHETHPKMSGFAWQVGYSAFTVSRSGVPDVKRYIAHQAEHHKRFSFQEELLELLRLHEVEYDPKYIWE